MGGKMKRNLLSACSFLLILALLLAGASWLLYPKDNKDIGRRADRLSTGLLAEEENTVDVLFIGDSLPMYGTAAPQLWAWYGIPAYTYATPQQNLVKSRRMLRRALKRQSPKVVFLEVNGLYREIGDQEVMSDWLCSWIPVAEYHDNWKKIPLRELLQPVHYNTVQESKGYYLNMYQSAPATADYMHYDDPEAEPLPEAVGLLKTIGDLCRRKGIKLILYSVPNAVSWNWARHDAVSRVSKELELTYLDLNTEDVGIDWSTDCMDNGDHLNYLGASKATAWLGNWLVRNEALADKRGTDGYALWNQQVERFLDYAEQTAAEGLIPQ